MNQVPRKINETGLYRPVWEELNRIIAYLREISPVAGRGMQVKRQVNGTLFSVQETPRQNQVEIRQYRIESIQNDFYAAKLWTGTAVSGGELYIARPFEHRLSNFDGRTIAYSSDGDAFSASYSYSSATKRVKTVAGVAETQVLTPYFLPENQLIYAVEVKEVITVGAAFTPLTDPNDEPITLLDLNVDGRAWTKFEVSE